MSARRAMIPNDFTGKAVLVTGGTKGLGLATGLAFGEQGAHVYLTHKWGSAEPGPILEAFARRGAPAPALVEADAAEAADTAALMERIRADHDRVEVFVSNVSFAQVGPGMSKYRKKRHLLNSLGYSAWPLIEHLQQMKEVLGSYPRYALATSCDGPDTYYPGYDFVAASKAVMETLCRYVNTYLFEEDFRINILRSRPVSTESLVATFGEGFEPFLRKYHGDEYFIEAEEVGSAILALCSGLMDAVSGQVILLDRGVGFCDNLMRLYEHREDYGLS